MQLAPYKAWRRTLVHAATSIETVYKEVSGWMEERSERWQESNPAEQMEADCERLEEVLAALGELEALGPQK